MGSTSTQDWEDLVRQKREARAALIAPWLKTVNGDHESSVNVLTINNVSDLTSLYANGQLRARDVVRRYIQR